MKKVQLNLECRTQDNGDGSTTTYLYNNLGELAVDHPEYEEGMTVEDIVRLMDDDPYEHGSHESETVGLLILDDGTVKLDGSWSIYGGQQ